ncbi:nuclear pore complex protein DDB_G0274915-like [Gigantopelta aegis]|uniref:nuclear pore complex protein DDB_G0274915-like n=1 Tax=Gigantopelta aegis TaxID=1735272 RepID=UPI001B887403|nr:nuclear pore complex protein DDB_G0274915-like [Gigantopelta aegis]
MLFSFNPYIILLLLFLITWCLLNYQIAFFLSGLGLVGLLSDALSPSTGEVYDREQVPVSEKDERSKRKLKKKFKMFKSWNPFRRKPEKSKENIASQRPKADRFYQDEDPYNLPNLKDRPKIKSATPGLTRQHRSFVVNNSQQRNSEVYNSTNNRSVLNASGPLLSTPLLPRVKRAVGANESFSQFSPGFSPSIRSGNRSITRSSTFHYAPNHPTKSTPGTLPTVRLRKTNRRSFLDTSNSYSQSPNTVKIAPPDQSVIFSPRVLPLIEQKPVNQKPIDTQAVVCALRQRRKRSMVQTDETFVNESDQQAKRRRQDSSQSTASSSSLPPMPENLPDLSNTSLMMHLDPVSMKRPSAPSRDPIDNSDMHRDSPAKRARGESKNNPILSSLSSAKRALDKSVLVQRDSLKRKPLRSVGDCEESVSEFLNSSDLVRDEQKCAETSMDVKEDQFTKLHEKTESDLSSLRNKSQNDSSTSTPSKQPVLDGITMSARRRQRSLYPTLNTSFQNVITGSLSVSVEDYEQDRAQEQQRVHDMLNEVEAAHKRKQNKGQVATSTSESLGTATTSVFSSTAQISLGGVSATSTSLLLTTSTSTASTSQATSVVPSLTTAVTASSSSATSSSVTTQPQYSFKPVFGSTAVSQATATTTAAAATASGLVSTPASSTTTTQPSGFSMVFPPPGSAASQSTEKAPPPYQSNTSNVSATNTLAASQGLSAPAASNSTPAGLSTTLVSSTSAQGSLSATSTLGGLFSASVQSSIPSTSVQNALPATSTLGGLFSASVQSSMPSASAQNGLSTTSAHSGLLSSSVQTGLSPLSVLSALSSTTGISDQMGVSSQAQPTSNPFKVPNTHTSTSSALGTSGGFSFAAPADKAVTNAAQTLFAASTPVTSSQATSSLGASLFAASAAAAVASSKAVSSSGSLLFGATSQSNTGNPGQSFAFGSGGGDSNPKPVGFNFGQPASTAGPVFGSSGGQPDVVKSGKDALKVNLFGASPAPTSSKPSPFSFGQPPSQTSAVPNQQVSSAPGQMLSSGFNFGTAPSSSSANPNAQNKPSAGFLMSAGQPSSQPSQSAMFNFGAENATSGNTFGAFGSSVGTVAATTVSTGPVSGGPALFSFGGPSASQPKQNFGFSAATTASNTFAFNAASSQPQKSQGNTMPSSMFGMPNQSGGFGSTQPKSSGPVFGSTTAAPSFGSSTAAVFGNTGDKKPGGMAGSSSGFNFGVSQPTFGGGSQTSAPMFEAGQAAPAFGASQATKMGFGASQAPAQGFGASQAPAQGFGASQTPAQGFGASQTPAQGFGASQTPAQGFGSTPAQVPNFGSSVAAFGTPALGSATFQFGQSGGQPSTENKGFNFSASSPPVFNFGSTNPIPQIANNMFTNNTSSGIPQKPRAAGNRSRRRVLRK